MSIAQAESQKFYTVKEAADILRIHYRTVLTLLKQGKITHLRYGRFFRIPEEALRIVKKGG